MLNLPEGIGLQQLEGEILQLPLEAADAEPLARGGVDLPGLAGDALLLLGLERTECAHVVEAIGQLHQHHTDVAGHRQEHLAQVLRLGFGSIVEMNAAELGDPLHQLAHLSTEMLLDLIRRDVGVLDHVVQEAGGDDTGAGADVPEQIGHGHRVDDVGVATGPELALVELESEIKGRDQQGFRIRGAALADARRHIADALTQPLRQRDAVVVRIADRMTAQFRQIASDELDRHRSGKSMARRRRTSDPAGQSMVFSAQPRVSAPPSPVSMSRPVLELEQLRLRYPGNEHWTLNGLDLTLEAGETELAGTCWCPPDPRRARAAARAPWRRRQRGCPGSLPPDRREPL